MKKIISNAKSKLKNRHGASLGEMLVCVLILLLASGLLVSGVSLAAKQFERVFSKSQAQVIKSTLSSAISEELRYTSHVWIEKDGDSNRFDGYFSKKYGGDKDNESRFSLADDEGSTLDSKAYGYICVAGHGIVPNKVYSHGYRANVQISPVVSKSEEGEFSIDYFTVSLSIKRNQDEASKETTTFMVIPVNEPKVDVK